MTSIRHVISEADDIGITDTGNGEEMVCTFTAVLQQPKQQQQQLQVVVEDSNVAATTTDDDEMRLDSLPQTTTNNINLGVTNAVSEHNVLLHPPPQMEVIGISPFNNNIIQPYNHLHKDIPPTIQSLQQQYYSSSSLSGDEDDDGDDEPLIQGVILKAQDARTANVNEVLSNNNNTTKLETIDTPNVQQESALSSRRLTAIALPRVQSGSSSTQSSSSRIARSSQNSSRDWGWFDDVHATNHSTEMMGHNLRNASTTRGGVGTTMTGGVSHLLSGNGGGAGHHGDMNKNGKNQHVTIGDQAVIMMMNDDDTDTNVMAVTAPQYVLEESLSSQFLWKNSAGQRPPQPVEERAFYEKMWAQNFERSNVEYNIPVEVLTATSPLSLDPFSDSNCDTDYAHHTISTVPPMHMDGNGGGHHHHGGAGAAGTDIAEAALVYRMNDDRNQVHNNHNYNNNNALHNYYSAPVKREVKDTAGDGTLTVLVRGDNVFGTTVSKSFARTNRNGEPIAGGVDTINISIASYRVVESSKHGKYAQFLVIYRQGSIRDTVGIWKRYRDFEELAHKVTQAHEGCVAAFANISPLHITTTGNNENETEHLPNAITSWRLLKKRKRWYRCLDAGYLSLKVFLLERFLHDILFESSSPHLLRDFVGVNSVNQMF